MSKSEKGLKYFDNGYSCSQAVFAPFAEKMGIAFDTALKLSQGFGGGMAGMGDRCGAVTGAYMAIGLVYGRGENDSPEMKEKTYEVIKNFNSAFNAEFGGIDCRELLGHDMGTEDGKTIIKERGLTKTLCPIFVKRTIEILEKELRIGI